MYVKGADGLYEVKTSFGSIWFDEEIFQAGCKALRDKGIDPKEDPDKLCWACADEQDKRLLPSAELMAALLYAGIGTEDPGDDEEDYDDEE